jgi:hypothetical protein
MTDILADMSLVILRELHYKHDGAPTQSSLVACRYLNQKFPAWWIGRGGLITWSPCSPDLNPLDFYL